MDKITAMFSKLSRKGSSDEDGRRSAQSTPRLSHRVLVAADRGRDTRRSLGSLGSMENYRVQQPPQQPNPPPGGAAVPTHTSRDRIQDQRNTNRILAHSWDLDRVPGLDRAWELERQRGMELLYQSMERQRERQRSVRPDPQGEQPAPPRTGRDRDRSRGKKKKKRKDRSPEKAGRSRSHSQGPDRVEHLLVDPNFRLSQERLERRVDELNHQLLEEKHSSRRDKLTLARLQQEVARQKSERQLRETLMRELERERMLRVDAETRLRDMTVETETWKSRMAALQAEFGRMEEMLHGLAQHKARVEALKQEKAHMSMSYEKSLQKLRSRLCDAEQENRLLMLELQKMESQCNNCHLCNNDLSYRVAKGSPGSLSGEDVDRSRVLLERLKMLEAEKTSLVLENETQRQQYEKCLDDIANQVVQALLSQKLVREECSKLQQRVMDLEHQNRHLGHMFHSRIRFASDSFLQAMASNHKLQHSDGSLAAVASSTSDPAQAGGGPMYPHALPAHFQMMPHQIGECAVVSVESLQSICSDYDNQVSTEEGGLGKPELSSPPPWLKDKMFQSGTSPTSSIASPNTMEGTSGSASSAASIHGSLNSMDSATGPAQPCSHAGRKSALPVVSLPAAHLVRDLCPEHAQSVLWGHLGISPPGLMTEGAECYSEVKQNSTGASSGSEQGSRAPSVCVHSPGQSVGAGSPSRHSVNTGVTAGAAMSRHDDIVNALATFNEQMPSGPITFGLDGRPLGMDASPGQELLKMSDSFHEKFTINQSDGLPHIQGSGYEESDSDEGPSVLQRYTKDMSMASTLSLNDILDRGLEEMQTPGDDDFSIEDFPLVDSDEERERLAAMEDLEGMEFGEKDEDETIIHVSTSPVRLNNVCVNGVSGAVPSNTVLVCSSKQSTSPGSQSGSSLGAAGPHLLNNHAVSAAVTSVDTSVIMASGSQGSSPCSSSSRLNNHSHNSPAKVTNKPPLPRPNTLDLHTTSSRRSLERNQGPGSKGCLEYSDSSSDSSTCSDSSSYDSESSSSECDAVTPIVQPPPPPPRVPIKPAGHCVVINWTPKKSPQHPPKGRKPKRKHKDRSKSKDRKKGKEALAVTSTNSALPTDNKPKVPCKKPLKDHYELERMPPPHHSPQSSPLSPPTTHGKLINQDSGISETTDEAGNSEMKSSKNKQNSKVITMTSPKPPVVQGMSRASSSESHCSRTQLPTRLENSCSPDSAMQHSFSSTSSGSETVLGDKAAKDDGYSSTSAASAGMTTVTVSVGNELMQNTGFYGNNITAKPVTKPAADLRGDYVKLQYSPTGALQAGASTATVPSPDTRCSKVKDMKAYFEGKKLPQSHKASTSTPSLVRNSVVPAPPQPCRPREAGDYVYIDPYWPPLSPVSTGNGDVHRATLSSSDVHRVSFADTSPNSATSTPHITNNNLPVEKSVTHYPTVPSGSKALRRSHSLPAIYGNVTNSHQFRISSHLSKSLPCITLLNLESLALRADHDTLLQEYRSRTSPSRPPCPGAVRVMPGLPASHVTKSPRAPHSPQRNLANSKPSKGKHAKDQCIVGYAFEDKNRAGLFPHKLPSQGAAGQVLWDTEVKGQRLMAEGAEHGYRSDDNKRPEVVGSESLPLVKEHNKCHITSPTSSAAAPPVFMETKPKLPPTTTHRTLFEDWSSDSDMEVASPGDKSAAATWGANWKMCLLSPPASRAGDGQSSGGEQDTSPSPSHTSTGYHRPDPTSPTQLPTSPTSHHGDVCVGAYRTGCSVRDMSSDQVCSVTTVNLPIAHHKPASPLSTASRLAAHGPRPSVGPPATYTAATNNIKSPSVDLQLIHSPANPPDACSLATARSSNRRSCMNANNNARNDSTDEEMAEAVDLCQISSLYLQNSSKRFSNQGRLSTGTSSGSLSSSGEPELGIPGLTFRDLWPKPDQRTVLEAPPGEEDVQSGDGDFDLITKQIDELNKSVEDLEDSLQQIGVSSDTTPHTQPQQESLSNISVPDFKDAQSRADYLDQLFNSSSGTEDEWDDFGDAFVNKFKSKKNKSGNGPVRQVGQQRPSVHTSAFFRYDEPEKKAMAEFSFLNDIPSSGDENCNPSSTGQRHMETTRNHHGDNPSYHDNSTVSGARCYGWAPVDVQKYHVSAPKHPAVEALKEESRREQQEMNRLSNSSVESYTRGQHVADLSMSDSCCEGYSSSTPSINHTTIL